MKLVKISRLQISAAMSLAQLNQRELAERVGMAQPSLNNILTGQVAEPRVETINRIQAALEACGVEFMPRDGVAMRDDTVRRLSGPDCYLHLLREIDDELKVSKGEVLFSFVDHRLSSPEVVSLIEQMQSHEIKARLLTGEDMNRLLWPRHSYRIVPAENFVNRVIIIYSDHVATAVYAPDGTYEYLVLRNKPMADGMRAMFEGWWRHSPMPEAQHV